MKSPSTVGLLLAGEVAHESDPAGVVDHALEGLAGLDAVMKLEAGRRGVVAALGVAVPLLVFERRELVDGPVEVVHEVRFDRLLQHEVAAQVEEKVVKRGGLPGLHGDASFKNVRSLLYDTCSEVVVERSRLLCSLRVTSTTLRAPVRTGCLCYR